MCSHYSIKSHGSVSVVPGEISFGVIPMDGVKAFEKIAMAMDLHFLLKRREATGEKRLGFLKRGS